MCCCVRLASDKGELALSFARFVEIVRRPRCTEGEVGKALQVFFYQLGRHQSSKLSVTIRTIRYYLPWLIRLYLQKLKLKQVLIILISTTRTNSPMFFLMNWTENARLSFGGLYGLRFVV